MKKASVEKSSFFRKYGSHVYTGQHLFGGAYLIRTCGTDETAVHREHDVYIDGIKSMQFVVNVSSEERGVNIWHDCFKIGSLNGHCTLPIWELVLKTQNRDWALIKMGSQNRHDYIGIWDLIRRKFKDSKKSVNLSEFLKKEWENVSEVPKDDKLGTTDVVIHLPDRSKEQIHSQVSEMLPSYLNKVLSCGQEIMTEFAKNEIFVHDRILSLWCHFKVEIALKEVLCYLMRNREFIQYLALIETSLNHGYDLERMAFLPKLSMQSIQQLSDSVAKIKTNKDCSQSAALREFVELANKRHASAGSQNIVQKTLQHIRSIPIGMRQDVRQILFIYDNDLRSIVERLDSLDKYKSEHCSPVEPLKWNIFEEMDDQVFFDIVNNRKASATVKTPNALEPKACIRNILDTLGLSSRFRQKISLQDVQCLHDKMYSNPEHITDIPWVILRKIITIDCAFREMVLEEFVSKHSTESESPFDLFSDFESEIDKNEENISDDSIENLHPSDVLLAILSCSDLHLQKVLAEKIALCQFAIPFIYPDFIKDDLVASTWPLRGIILGSNCKSVISMPAKKVSFIKIGEFGDRSKSKLIDVFLRDQNEEHATFFHKDCAMGHNERKISNGVIEISWFLPSTRRGQEDVEVGKDDDANRERKKWWRRSQ